MAINKIHHKSFLEGIKSIPDETFDLCITDPPYRVISGGKGGSGGRPSGMLAKNDGKIFKHNNIEITDWLPEVYRVLKEDTHCYVFTNTINLEEMIKVSREVGFKLHNLLVWEKNNCTPNRWYMKNAEYVLFLRKGRAKRIKNVGSKTVHQFKNITGNKTHPTEKPVELLKFYIENSSNPGDLILEPFSGSGSLAIASLETDRDFIAYEIDDEYYKKSVDRVKKWKEGPEEDTAI